MAGRPACIACLAEAIESEGGKGTNGAVFKKYDTNSILTEKNGLIKPVLCCGTG